MGGIYRREMSEKILIFSYWAIPENIHTIPRTAFRISEGEGGVHDYGILRAWGVFTIGNPKAWGNSTGGISGVESVE